MKKDIHNHQDRFEKWKKDILNSEGKLNPKYIEEGLTRANSDVIIQYVLDMEVGRNVSNRVKKEGRSYSRLNNLRVRVSSIARKLQDRGIKDITKLTEVQITDFFSDMRKGILKTNNGKIYKSVSDYAKVFKAFWNWHMKVNRKKGIIVKDIIEDIDTSQEEQPAFVFMSKENLKKLLPYLEDKEQLIVQFVYDSIIRSPTELMSLQIKNIYEQNGEVWVNIPEAISKTFERDFNLLYCGQDILKYIKDKDPDDYLFEFSYPLFTRKLRKVAEQVFGKKISHAKAKGLFSDLTLYDLRHSGAINLRQLASKNGHISLDAIRQRGGWVTFKMLDYYTKFLGLDGHIEKSEIVLKEDKSKMENELAELKHKMARITGKMEGLINGEIPMSRILKK